MTVSAKMRNSPHSILPFLLQHVLVPEVPEPVSGDGPPGGPAGHLGARGHRGGASQGRGSDPRDGGGRGLDAMGPWGHWGMGRWGDSTANSSPFFWGFDMIWFFYLEVADDMVFGDLILGSCYETGVVIISLLHGEPAMPIQDSDCLGIWGWGDHIMLVRTSSGFLVWIWGWCLDDCDGIDDGGE